MSPLFYRPRKISEAKGGAAEAHRYQMNLLDHLAKALESLKRDASRPGIEDDNLEHQSNGEAR